MYTALFVDDEKPQREGIEKHVRWGEYGFAPPLLCSNGWEALERLRDAEVDLLLTDICMPGMDGLTMMAKARELRPALFIAVVSGYAEFRYAQSAIKNGAREYLLKPVKPEDVHRVLSEFVSWRASRDNPSAAQSGVAANVTRMLEEHVADGVSIDALAEAVHMNPSYLCTVFKKECGETIAERLSRLQRDRACMLLATSMLSVGEIAFQTGGRTASNFIQWFRKVMGVTPAEYRRITKQEK